MRISYRFCAKEALYEKRDIMIESFSVFSKLFFQFTQDPPKNFHVGFNFNRQNT